MAKAMENYFYIKYFKLLKASQPSAHPPSEQ
jgi:hypothetical protein